MSETYESQSDCSSSSCSDCKADCSSRKTSKQDFLVPLNPYSKVKKVIGIVSGKGGVGKSFVTSYLSVLMRRKGYSTAILDADITGPSIPKAFGIHTKAKGNEMGIFPEVSDTGIKIMSVNLLLDTEDTPVIWRGPVIAGTVKQFWSEVLWEDVDYMFVDMPPGTGDVPLTVFQSLPLDGIIIVTSPQELVSMIVSKAVNMAESMEIPILGLVENYSYIQCGGCGEKISVFGTSHINEISEKYNLPVLGRVPIDPAIASAVDSEKIEQLSGDWLDVAAVTLGELLGEKRSENEEVKVRAAEVDVNTSTKIAVPTDDEGNVFKHFGKTSQFTMYEFKNNELVNKIILKSEGEGHGSKVSLLSDNLVNVVICGGIGFEAMEGLMNKGIVVMPGAGGDVDVVTAAYLDGSLTGDKNAAHSHGEGCKA